MDGGFFFVIIGMFALMYFLVIRPQMKRAKEQKEMIGSLQKGDEIVAAGGLVGKITNIGETYISLEIAPNTEVAVEKQSILKPLPKGTIKSI